MDLRGAFTLLDFDPRWVPFLGTELECGLFIFYLVGYFGWSTMPMAFNVITRALVWELQQPGVLRGRMGMLVDDIFGVCRAWDLAHDMNAAAALCRRLLGERAVAEHKTESGVRLTLLGWDIDLAKMLMMIARKNALRAFFGYAHLDLFGMIPVTVGVGGAEYDTSLFPKGGAYLVPIRAEVRQSEALEEGGSVTVRLSLRSGKAGRTVRRSA